MQEGSNRFIGAARCPVRWCDIVKGAPPCGMLRGVEGGPPTFSHAWRIHGRPAAKVVGIGGNTGFSTFEEQGGGHSTTIPVFFLRSASGIILRARITLESRTSEFAGPHARTLVTLPGDWWSLLLRLGKEASVNPGMAGESNWATCNSGMGFQWAGVTKIFHGWLGAEEMGSKPNQ